jgi:adenosine 3'-phospho 5'-phosphosulfate transporter B2
MYKRLNSKTPVKDAPFYMYCPASLSNSISSWAQYEALKYVSFPAQVLSKSCKIIPVMLVGILINKKSYPIVEYVEAILITSGVAMFSFSERKNPSNDNSSTAFGIMLLVLYLGCDSVTSQWQSKVYKAHGVDQFQMMLGINLWSILLTGNFTLLNLYTVYVDETLPSKNIYIYGLSGISLFYSGEMITSVGFILADSTAMGHMIILSLASAVGQLFIFYTIKEFGPVVFTIMMTTRQIFSLILSCFVFSHPLSLMSWFGSLVVFAVIFYRIKRGER